MENIIHLVFLFSFNNILMFIKSKLKEINSSREKRTGVGGGEGGRRRS
jgi:hypothetical protein